MNTPEPVSRQPSCDDESDPALLPVDTALERIAQAVTPISDLEVVALREALDRVLGVDIQSPMAVPNHTNSAMDGYALRFADLNGTPLRMAGKKRFCCASLPNAIRVGPSRVSPIWPARPGPPARAYSSW